MSCCLQRESPITTPEDCDCTRAEVLLSFLSFVFSLNALMTASRVLLSINKLHPRDVLQCLESLDEWDTADGFWWFNRSLVFLLLAVWVLVDLLYDHTCFLLCGVLALVPLGMMWHLHRAHVAVVWPMIRLAAEGSASASASGSASLEATPSSSERLVEQGLKLQV
ncbi:unnamed protein product [Durusdinium trenchii]|uniref:Glycerophosphocholine acyltransferase 1 n=1 Tax=Durusdinium trenchii TaxID=1381693 RepID=A0ABP0IQS3_9DINO